METARSGRLQRSRIGLLAVQDAALFVAAAFFLIAIAGFITGLTSRSHLFGVFEISVLHNLLHLIFGVAGLLLATSFARARAYLIGGGLVYFGLWVYGLIANPGDLPKMLPLNNADNWLHFSIGVVMVVLGLTLAGTKTPTGANGEPLIDPDE
jgi:hypothetical protein